jgi:hypothetical protein
VSHFCLKKGRSGQRKGKGAKEKVDEGEAAEDRSEGKEGEEEETRMMSGEMDRSERSWMLIVVMEKDRIP